MLWIYIIVVAVASLGVLRAWSRAERPHALIFHPFHTAGGGGERVLWVAVRGLLNRGCRVAIISGSAERSVEDMTGLIENQFGISFKHAEFRELVGFIQIGKFARLLDHSLYPTAAVLMQNLAAALLTVCVAAKIIMGRTVPTVFIDTTGFAFTVPVAKALLGCRTAAYVHYPTMPRDKADDQSSSILKRLYYRVFVKLYALAGQAVDVTMTNSNWTDERIRHTWRRLDTVVVYPPVKLPRQLTDLSGRQREDAIVSLGQFRPEKNHKLQLDVFARLAKKFPTLRFWIIGGARDGADLDRVTELKQLAAELDIVSRVEFVVNASRAEVDRRLKTAKIAIHTMVDEHFGISLLEFLAAGLVVVAHKSGGPEKDILLNDSGFLATTENDYVDLISKAFANYETAAIKTMIGKSKQVLQKFNDDDKFAQLFADLVL